MKEKRKITYKDLKKIVQFKTFYIIVLLLLIGVIFLLINFSLGKYDGQSTLKGILCSLGITFITSSIVSLLMEVYLRLDIVDFMSEKMLSVMPDSIRGNSGIIEFNSDRKLIDFKEKWKKTDTFMKIIGVSANDILASANFSLIKKRLEEDKDFFIQILLLCPWSITAGIRSEASIYRTKHESIMKTHTVMMDIETFWETIGDFGSSRIELKLYDNIPSLSMIIDKNNAIVAPFMEIEQGGSSPYYIANNIETNNCLYNLYLNHFDTIWKNAHNVEKGTQLNDLYLQQREKDKYRVNNLPENYDNWIITVNKITKKEITYGDR